MAYGNELWLGFLYPEYQAVAPQEAARVEWPLSTDGSEDGILEDWPDVFELYADTLKAPLLDAWKNSAADMGWPKPKPAGRGTLAAGYWKIGAVEFIPFALDMLFGTEMEFAFPDVPVGVALSSRYFPTFIDHRSRHGTLPNPLVLGDPHTDTMIAVAKKRIVEAVPWFAAAKIMLVERHY